MLTGQLIATFLYYLIIYIYIYIFFEDVSQDFGGEEFSFGGSTGGGDEKSKDEKKEEKEGLTGVHTTTTGVQDSGTRKHMPPASVMTRLILIMVWRKLIRNPNTYSSLIGLIWSLISYR